MSLASSPDYLFRPEDKALKMLFPAADEPAHNLFDEYFDKELYALTNDDKEANSPTLNFLAFDPVEANNLSKAYAPRREATPQPWRKGLWCLKSKPTSELVVGKTRKGGHSAQSFISPNHLASNDNFATRSPPSPTKKSTKLFVPKPQPSNSENEQFTLNNVFREQTLSPSPMYAHLQSNNKMSYTDRWQENFQDFHLQLPTTGIDLITTPVTKQVQPNQQTQHQTALRQTNARVIARNATIAHTPQSSTKYHYPFQQNLAQDCDFFDLGAFASSVQDARNGTSAAKVEQLQNATYTTSIEDQYKAPMWTTESLHSSDSSYQSHDSQYSSGSYQNNHQGLSNQTWMTQPPPAIESFPFVDYDMNLAAPAPKRVAHQILNQQQEQMQNGLGIHCMDVDEIGVAMSYEPQNNVTTGYRAVTSPTAITNSFEPYPPLPPYPSEAFPDMLQFTTPRHRRATTYSRSPSPSSSPTRRHTPRGDTQCSPTRTDYTSPRRKSIHKPGPIKDTSQQDTSRRSRSASRPPRTPKTPKTPKTPTTSSFGQVGFVNFTPKDSAKLMSDVAPSGSSKTRARREQEARDKRRKLNEAALQAIRRAGGDVSALEKAIFV